MKNNPARPRVKVSADGAGVVSHAGTAMLREVADLTGLSARVTAALADTYRGPWVYAPGEVFADLASAVAGGANCNDGVGQRCGDREHAFGPAASTTTMWRLVDDKIDAAHLLGIRAARAQARAAAWAAGAAPTPGDWLHVDIDATITIDHSDRKELAAPTWKKTFGHQDSRHQDSRHGVPVRSVILCCELRIRGVSESIPNPNRDKIREGFPADGGVRR